MTKHGFISMIKTSKLVSKQLQQVGSPPEKKSQIKQSHSYGKVICHIFWDWKSVVLARYVLSYSTVTAKFNVILPEFKTNLGKPWYMYATRMENVVLQNDHVQGTYSQLNKRIIDEAYMRNLTHIPPTVVSLPWVTLFVFRSDEIAFSEHMCKIIALFLDFKTAPPT